MPIPQVNDRIKEAPAVMLRAVFAGVGQLLLAADKVRARAVGTGWPADRDTPKGQARAQSRWHTLDDVRGRTVPLARERTHSHNHSAEHPSAGSPDSATAGPATATQERPASSTAATPTPVTPAKPAERAVAPAEPAAAKPTAASKPKAAKPKAAKPTAVAKPAVGAKPTAAAKPAARPAAHTGPTARSESAAGAAPLPGYDDLSLPSLRARLRGLDTATLRAALAYEKAHAHRDDVITMFERRLAKTTTE